MNLISTNEEEPEVEELSFADARELPSNEAFTRVFRGEITHWHFIAKYPNVTGAFVAVGGDNMFRAEVFHQGQFNAESKFYYGIVIDADKGP